MKGALMEINGRMIHMSIRLSQFILRAMASQDDEGPWLDDLLREWGIFNEEDTNAKSSLR